MLEKTPIKPIDDLESYWATLHNTLAVDYTLPIELIDDAATWQLSSEDRKGADCTDIAREIIQSLAQKGLKSRALFIASRQVLDAQFRTPDSPTPTLKPKVLPGLEWTCHIVCEADGVIYDPVFSDPLPEKDYLERMFDQEVLVNPLTEL